MNENKIKPLLIYHGDCQDGFGAAWSVWKRHADRFDYYPGVHHHQPPDVAGRELFLADFSYPLNIMEALLTSAASVTIIDHHASAEKTIAPLIEAGYVKGIFDMEKSGAMLTWEWFHPEEKPPRLLKYIQDRDLYRFDLPFSREITSALYSFEYDFQIWETLMASDLEQLKADGIAIERKHQRDIRQLLKANTRRMCIGGYDVPVANLPNTMVSDAANLLAEGEPFAACYWDTADGRVFGLRSRKGGVDVAEVATGYGGGGHKHAAGFRIDLPGSQD